MKKKPLILARKALVLIGLMIIKQQAFAAASQILNDIFFLNPAEMSLVNQTKWIAGNLFIDSSFTFTGVSTGKQGKAHSNTNNCLPYGVGVYRLNERWVVGVNVSPSAYANVQWPYSSIVSDLSTTTKVLYYRTGIQSSYQFTDKFAIGIGFNVENNMNLELDLFRPNVGNQTNKVSGTTYTGDVGLLYKITPRHAFIMSMFTPINTLGTGTSTDNIQKTYNFRLNIIEAIVIYAGFQHQWTDKWYFSEKLYWSGWDMEKHLNFRNTTTGTYYIPTHWRNVVSVELITRYKTSEKLSLLGATIYESNANPTTTNAIGYPLAATTYLSAGVDIRLSNPLSIQLLYGYGFFAPSAKISNADAQGTVALNFQTGVVQLTYKT